MDENGSHRPVQGQNGYNRLTTQEPENHHPTATAAPTGAESVFQYCFDIHHQTQPSPRHLAAIDWDRIFMTAFVTISLVLILTASFFPFLTTDPIADQQFQHKFVLSQLAISEFRASPAQLTGKCHVILNVTNLGDRSLYHENSVLSIFLDHELLWVTRTDGFFLQVGDEIPFDVSMNTTTVSIPASFVPTALLESRELHKPLRFKIKYDGMLREGLDAWHEERSHVYVVCGWIEMQFFDETTLMGGPASCTLEIF